MYSAEGIDPVTSLCIELELDLQQESLIKESSPQNK